MSIESPKIHVTKQRSVVVLSAVVVVVLLLLLLLVDVEILFVWIRVEDCRRDDPIFFPPGGIGDVAGQPQYQ